MSYTKGTVKTELAFNVFNEMRDISPEKANTYCKLGGYTRGTDGTQMITMLSKDKNEEGVLVSHLKSTTKISSVKKDMGHANDCTYYDGVYYVATGGGNVTSNTIKRYDANFKALTDYTCPSNVTCIAHCLSDYFFLGNGANLQLCKLDKENNRFVKVNSNELKLKEEGTEVEGWTRQGMCYFDNYLYKIYSEDSTQIRKNYIAKYRVNGVSANTEDLKKITLSNLVAIYACNNELVTKFELEAIDVGNNEIFVAINMWISSKDPSSRICKATLTS